VSRPTEITLNLLMPVTLGFVLYVGLTGLVSWWAIGLIALSHSSVEYTWRTR
jgi:hypothetical protein